MNLSRSWTCMHTKQLHASHPFPSTTALQQGALGGASWPAGAAQVRTLCLGSCQSACVVGHRRVGVPGACSLGDCGVVQGDDSTELFFDFTVASASSSRDTCVKGCGDAVVAVRAQ